MTYLPVLIWFGMGALAVKIAVDRGRSGPAWAIGALFSAPLALLLALVLPKEVELTDEELKAARESDNKSSSVFKL